MPSTSNNITITGLTATDIETKLKTLDSSNSTSDVSISYKIINNNILLITSPLSGNANENEPLYTEVINAILGNANYHIVAALTGEGITEGHVTTLYSPQPQQNTNREYTIFDSKTSDMEALLKSPNTTKNPGPTKRTIDLWKIIKGLFRDFFYPSFETESRDKNIHYISLGTQSFFDPVSCGYHTIENIKHIINIIKQNKPVNRDNLLAKIAEKKNNIRANQANTDDTKFQNIAILAFQKTFSSIDHNQGFLSNLMGWPATSGWLGKTAYIALGGWLFRPLANLIKAVTELPIALLLETARYAKFTLFCTAPTGVISQYARGLGIMLAYTAEGASIAARTLMRTVTAPIDNAKELSAIHPALGIASIMTSACAYFALTVFAAPVVTTVATHIGLTSALSSLGSLPIVSSIVKPALTLLQHFGITGAASMTGAVALTTAASGVTVAHGTREVIAENDAPNITAMLGSCNGSTSLLCNFLQPENHQQKKPDELHIPDGSDGSDGSDGLQDFEIITVNPANDARLPEPRR